MQKAKSPKRGPGKAANRKAALSAQQTIPYLVMHPDGVCQLPGGLYTKTVEYEDINYSVASTEDQTAIFSGWSSFLNYFDSSLPFQLSFINRRSRSRSKYKVNIPPAQDDFDSIRAEFTSMLKNQIAKSNNGIERSKYITFGLPAEGIAEARPRLERVEADVTGNLKRLGVPSAPMDGQERLALLHSQMHPGSREPFRFSWQDIPRTGMGTKDFIAPDIFDFRQSRTFRVGQYWGAASYLQILASELSDKLLAEILELDAEMTVTGSLCGPRLAGGDGLARELTREEKRAIRALVTKWCANYDRECGCLPLDCECYMLGKCWTGALCRYFREAVLPLDPALEAALLTEGPRPDFKICPICGGPVAPDRRQAYCSAACAKKAHRRQQREYMRKKRGWGVDN